MKLLVLLIMFGTIAALGDQTRSSNKGSSNAKKPEGDLLEIGRAAKLQPPPKAGAEIKLVSYNIRWRGGDDLQKLVRFFKDDREIGGASILGLQEVDRNRKRTGNKNTVKVMANELGLHYAWAAPPSPVAGTEEETGVALLSRYPLTDVHRIVLPHEGPNGRRRVALGATIRVGDSNLRVYSVHAETRLAIDKKIGQLKAVLEDLALFPQNTPAVIAGDFNSWELGAEERVSRLFTSEGFHTPFYDEPTFSRRALLIFIHLKLDWIWLRNLDATKAGIDKEISLSDHWPLWVALRIKPVRV